MLYGSDNQRDAYYEASLFCCLLSLFYIVLLLCATHNDLVASSSLQVQWLDDSCELCLTSYRRENRMCNLMLCNKCRTAILVAQYRCPVCSDLLDMSTISCLSIPIHGLNTGMVLTWLITFRLNTVWLENLAYVSPVIVH